MRLWWMMLAVGMLAGCTSVPQRDQDTELIEWGAYAAAARSQYKAAMDYLSQGRQADAERIVAEGCLDYPDGQRLLFLRALLERSRSHITAASGLFAQAYELGPDTWMGQAADLVVTMDVGLQIEPGFDQLAGLIDAYPEEPLIRWLFAIESTQFNQRKKEGARQFEWLLGQWKIGPAMVHHTYSLLLTSGLDQPEKALTHQQLAAELEPGGQTYQGMAFTLYRLERYTEADQVFGKLLELEPQHALFWFQWGNCLARMENYADAAEKFEKACRINSDALSLVCWGRCLELQGRLQAGYAKYEQALELSNGPAVAAAYVAIGKLYGYGTPCSFEAAVEVNTGANEPAIDLLRRQVKLADQSDNPLAPENSGTLIKHLNALAGKDDPEAQYSLAMIYRHGIGMQKDADESKKWLQRAAGNGHAIAIRMLNPPL